MRGGGKGGGGGGAGGGAAGGRGGEETSKAEGCGVRGSIPPHTPTLSVRKGVGSQGLHSRPNHFPPSSPHPITQRPFQWFSGKEHRNTTLHGIHQFLKGG